MPELTVNENKPTVYVVDDNPGSRSLFSALLKTLDVSVVTFQTAEAFLEAYTCRGPACLVLDLALPGIGGLQLQAELEKRELFIPVIIVTGYSDVASAVQCMKAGAMDYFEKPIQNHAFLESVRKALQYCQKVLDSVLEKKDILRQIDQLTQREKQVLTLIIEGRQNKDIAQELKISVKTVEVHRGNLMQKMQSSGVVQLVRKYLTAYRQ